MESDLSDLSRREDDLDDGCVGPNPVAWFFGILGAYAVLSIIWILI
jgi:hypothetical protein